MLAKSATPAEIIAMETPQQAMENHPVIRTLYDHIDVSVIFTKVFPSHSNMYTNILSFKDFTFGLHTNIIYIVHCIYIYI